MDKKLIKELSKIINEIASEESNSVLLEWGPDQLKAQRKAEEEARLERVRWRGLTDEQRETEISGYLDTEKQRIDAEDAETERKRRERAEYEGYDPDDKTKGIDYKSIFGNSPRTLRDRWVVNRNEGGYKIRSDFRGSGSTDRKQYEFSPLEQAVLDRNISGWEVEEVQNDETRKKDKESRDAMWAALRKNNEVEKTDVLQNNGTTKNNTPVTGNTIIDNITGTNNRGAKKAKSPEMRSALRNAIIRNKLTLMNKQKSEKRKSNRPYDD